MKKFEFFTFQVRKVFNEKFKLFLNIVIEKVKWILKSILEGVTKSIVFLTEKINQFLKYLFIFMKLKPKKLDELSENQKYSTIFLLYFHFLYFSHLKQAKNKIYSLHITFTLCLVLSPVSFTAIY